MARRPRPALAGGHFHITAKGNRDQNLFADDADRRSFLALVARVVDERGWEVLAWCLLANHFHLLVRTPEADLSAGMQRINGGHVLRFNRRHGLRHHLFCGRFHSQLVARDAHLKASLRYIALNPVRHGFCAWARAWPWSSHGTLVGRHVNGPLATAHVLELFGAPAVDGHAAYVAFVEGEGHPPAAPPLLVPPSPTVEDLLAAHGADDGARIAFWTHGYSHGEIAKATSLSRATIARRVMP